jgi:hypothetical protein
MASTGRQRPPSSTGLVRPRSQHRSGRYRARSTWDTRAGRDRASAAERHLNGERVLRVTRATLASSQRDGRWCRRRDDDAAADLLKAQRSAEHWDRWTARGRPVSIFHAGFSARWMLRQAPTSAIPGEEAVPVGTQSVATACPRLPAHTSPPAKGRDRLCRCSVRDLQKRGRPAVKTACALVGDTTGPTRALLLPLTDEPNHNSKPGCERLTSRASDARNGRRPGVSRCRRHAVASAD